ncbi:hypothetical protein [Prolixibacter sp. NT017]|uniref:hypothetical protein n=1 Tax=Prolixibacter sp. NT017 TaxID=2652390 RepID=UPI00127621EC|nr:hypothetical protein [Prolixibacter sp. NT017]GET24827.1 hypothetical protein NT017_11560 [Prolixibacter sp. NT017]
MKKTYRFKKAFGPVASTSGIIVFWAGVVASYFSLTGLALVFIGAFLGFTNTSTTIDYYNRRVKFSNNLFGLIRLGKWHDIYWDMQLHLVTSREVFTSYSRGNRSLDTEVKQTFVELYDAKGHSLLPLKSIGKNEDPEKELERLRLSLGLTTEPV